MESVAVVFAGASALAFVMIVGARSSVRRREAALFARRRREARPA